jgi:hypothetical protein
VTRVAADDSQSFFVEALVGHGSIPTGEMVGVRTNLLRTVRNRKRHKQYQKRDQKRVQRRNLFNQWIVEPEKNSASSGKIN